MYSATATSSTLLLFILFILTHFSTSFSQPDSYVNSLNSSLSHNASSIYFEITKPLQSNPPNPNCSLLLLQHDFGSTSGYPPASSLYSPLSSTSGYPPASSPYSPPSNTSGYPPASSPYPPPSNTSGYSPASSLYSPPSNCPSPWTQIILEFHVSCKGKQYNRIAGVWLDGVEILRTSTAQPTESGIFWNVRKDVTRYSSLLQRSNLTLTVRLENSVSAVFTGVYHVNVSLLYYGASATVVPSVLTEPLTEITASPLRKEGKLGFKRKFGFQSEELGVISKKPTLLDSIRNKNAEILYEKSADLILPVSNDGDGGFWFRIENEWDAHSKEIQIPLNAYRAVLEIYVSFHGNDEFWYSNPPTSYLELNNLTSARGNGAFREVFVKVDGVFVGSVVPFPVIFTGGINPLFWEPVVAIGAFDLPSYNLDLTPFLGMLLDGKKHLFEIGVTDGISYWYVDANLHLWLDPALPVVFAKTVGYQNFEISVERKSKFKQLDGKFKIEAKREFEFSGWVTSSKGNLTTHISAEFKVKNSITLKNNGQLKEVEQKIKAKTRVKVESNEGNSVAEGKFKSTYPLTITISTLPGVNDTYLLTTDVSHAQNEEASLSVHDDEFSSSISNNQVSRGWMEVQGHSVLSGTGSTSQTFSYKDKTDCYSRNVNASNGTLLEDKSNLCTAPA